MTDEGDADMERGLEPPAPHSYLLRLNARMAAEPHVLAAWAEDTQHPLLRDAYRILMERASPRAAELATALVEQTSVTRRGVALAMEEETAEATTTTFEPSRLKWLLEGRRERSGHDALPGYDGHRAMENEESEQLEALLQQVLRTMC